jgi:hypothetical protein
LQRLYLFGSPTGAAIFICADRPLQTFGIEVANEKSAVSIQRTGTRKSAKASRTPKANARCSYACDGVGERIRQRRAASGRVKEMNEDVNQDFKRRLKEGIDIMRTNLAKHVPYDEQLSHKVVAELIQELELLRKKMIQFNLEVKGTTLDHEDQLLLAESRKLRSRTIQRIERYIIRSVNKLEKHNAI